jgi:hypothetical protein
MNYHFSLSPAAAGEVFYYGKKAAKDSVEWADLYTIIIVCVCARAPNVDYTNTPRAETSSSVLGAFLYFCVIFFSSNEGDRFIYVYAAEADERVSGCDGFAPDHWLKSKMSATK